MIEPDRLLAGLARTLEVTVLPAVVGGFARGQLHAVLDVLDNLQGTTGWGGFLLENEASSLSTLLTEAAAGVDGELGAQLRAYEGLAAAPLAERLAEGRALVCSLLESGLADSGPLAAAVDSHLANDAVFKAMALRSTRFAEISQG